MAGAGPDDPAARKIRLESDADRVQVVTVHKSKGARIPARLPAFACACRPVKASDVPLGYHDDDGQARLALTADEAIVARADRERLGEDLRKLYVALTRALRHVDRHRLARRSAVAHLLGGTPSPAALEAWRGDCAQIAVDLAPESAATRTTRATRATRATSAWRYGTPLPVTPTARLARRARRRGRSPRTGGWRAIRRWSTRMAREPVQKQPGPPRPPRPSWL